MTDYRIAVIIDPGPAKSGGGVVRSELDKIEKQADKTKLAVTKALQFDGITGRAGVTSAAHEMADAIAQTETAMRKEAQAALAAKAATDALAVSEAHAAVMAREEANAHVLAWQAAQKHQGGSKNLAAQTKLTAQQMTQLSFQLNDVITGLISGQRPFQIMAQQGGQVYQALGMGKGGVAGGLAALGSMISVTAVLIVGFIGVLGLLAFAFLKGQAEADRLKNVLAVTGNYANITAGQFEGLVKTVGEDTNSSFGKARTTMLAFTASGKFTGDTIRLLSESTLELAHFTGQSADEITADFMRMGKNVGDFAVSFNEHYHLLTEAQIEHIRLLEDEGHTTQAQLAAAIAIHEQLGKIGPENLGYLERAWRAVGTAISNAWDALKRFGVETAPEAQLSGDLKSLQVMATQVAALRAQANSHPGSINMARIATEAEAGLATFRQRVALEQQSVGAAQATAQATADAAATQTKGIQAAEEIRGIQSSIADNATRAATAIQRYRDNINDLRKANPNSALLPSAAQQTATEAGIRRQYMPAATAAAHKAETEAERLAKAEADRLARLQLQADAMEANIKGNLDLAAAYGVSGDAAARAEAQRKGETDATLKKGDIDAFVARQLRQNAAEAAVDGAKRAADLNAQSDAQERANAAVADGSKTVQQAALDVQKELALRPLVTAAAVSEGDAKTVLEGVIQTLSDAMDRQNDTVRVAQRLAATTAQNDNIALATLQKDLETRHASNRERAIELAQLQAKQELIARGEDPNSATSRAYIQGQGNLAASNADTQSLSNKTVQGLDNSLENSRFQQAAERQAIIDEQTARLNIVKDGLAARQLTEQEAADRRVEIEAETQRKIRDLEVARQSVALTAASDTAASLADIAKKSLGEQSAVYKAMFIASKAFAIADSIIKIQQGIANALALPFPANFAAVAAVAAEAANIVSSIQSVGLELAGGGYVSGPGTSTSDSIPASLSDGEYVVKASATAANRPLLDAINSGRKFTSVSSGAGNDNSRGMSLKVYVNNMASGVEHEVRQISADEVEVIARRVVQKDAPKAIATALDNPNSQVSKSVNRNTTAGRRRGG